HSDAINLLEKTLPLQKTKLGKVHAETLATISALLDAYVTTQRLDQEETLCRNWLAETLADRPGDRALILSIREHLGDCLLRAKKYAAAEKTMLESLANADRESTKSMGTATAQALLGASLVGQKKYAEAERPLLAGYAGIKATANANPAKQQARL